MGGSVLAMIAWAVVAHNSGSGWVQAVGALLAGSLLVGLVAPAFVVRRAHCSVVAAPADGSAGRPSEVSLTTSSLLRVQPVDPPGPAVMVTPRRATAVTVVPARRGEVVILAFDVASAAPFGLLWWHRRIAVPLRRPLVVAPRLGEPDEAAFARDPVHGDEDHPRAARVGEPRGVRPYQPGDLRHWVHWPATAHAGLLMVRDMEEPRGRPVTMRVSLPADADDAERVAERAYGTVARLLGRGCAVNLVTDEPDGERAGPVAGVVDAGRRLARAASPDPARAPGPSAPSGPALAPARARHARQ